MTLDVYDSEFNLCFCCCVLGKEKCIKIKIQINKPQLVASVFR